LNSRDTSRVTKTRSEYDDLTRPEQLNVQADHRATEALDELRADDTITEFYPIPTCGSYLATAPYLTSHEIRTLRTEFTEYELRAYLQRRNDWSDKVYDSISWPAYRQCRTSLTISGHLWSPVSWWLPIGVRERCSGTTDTCPQCSEIETVPHLTAASPEHSGATGL
jgi:hypothetical protein